MEGTTQNPAFGEVVEMVIEKFGKEPVKIGRDHPLAIAQREKDAKASDKKSSK